MAKGKYITQGYIEKVEHYIYNNLDISDLYNVPLIDDQFNEEYAKEVCKEGEKYVRLEGNDEHFILTSYGRLINTHRGSQMQVKFTPNHIHAYSSSGKVDIHDIFLQNGWEYDIPTLKAIYKKYKWRYVEYEKQD
jgi:hypothetical protein